MTFVSAPADFPFSLVRLVSSGGTWEVGYYPATFGRVDCGGFDLNYCAGSDPALRLEILLCVLLILEPVDEAKLTHELIRKTFPGWTHRPIDKDPHCLPRLRELAGLSPTLGREMAAIYASTPHDS